MYDTKTPPFTPTVSKLPTYGRSGSDAGVMPSSQRFQPDVEFTFLSRPGHGWLMVPEAWIFACCLEPASFTSCSYVSSDYVYALEEDCDAAIFAGAFERRFNRPFKIREVYVDQTEIRGWLRLLISQAA